jgi:hypothetical protein
MGHALNNKQMKTIEQQLYDYIDNQKGCEQITRSGIIISTPDIYYLSAEFIWVNAEDASVSVQFDSEMKAFVKTLGIKNVRDIDALAPGKLMELYYEGLAEIVCFVSLHYTYGMTFKKQGNIVVAENERGVKHNIPVFEKLETPDQLIGYAKRYYKLMECNEN